MNISSARPICVPFASSKLPLVWWTWSGLCQQLFIELGTIAIHPGWGDDHHFISRKSRQFRWSCLFGCDRRSIRVLFCGLEVDYRVFPVSRRWLTFLPLVQANVCNCASSVLLGGDTTLEIAGPRLLHIHSYSFHIHAVCLRPAVVPQSPNCPWSIFSKFAQV